MVYPLFTSSAAVVWHALPGRGRFAALPGIVIRYCVGGEDTEMSVLTRARFLLVKFYCCLSEGELNSGTRTE